MNSMASPEQLRIMAVAAHAADPFDLCGGTLATYAAGGHPVAIVVLSLGAKSHTMLDMTLEELREVKRGEVRAAADRLGATQLDSLELEEDPLELGRDVLDRLIEAIRSFRPDIVVTHHALGDTIPDHAETGRLVWHACRCAGRPGFKTASGPHIVRNIFAAGMSIPTNGQRLLGSPIALPDLYFDVSGAVDRKKDALCAFASQGYTPEFIDRAVNTLNGFYGFESGVDYAEPFYSLNHIVVDRFPLARGVANQGRSISPPSSPPSAT
jgi:LmbE family N-acetylglucosaminyl deacetylase